MTWKDDKDSGPWKFEKIELEKNPGFWSFKSQEDKWGYLNNPRWSSQQDAQEFCEKVGLSLDSPEHHLPCGHWHKKYTSQQTFLAGKWVATMPQPNTPYIYLYDITYKAVIKLETSIPPVVVDILSLGSLYSLDYDVGQGNPGAQRGGYCMNKNGTRLWYLFRNTSGDCQLIEVDISGTMNIIRKTTFSNLVPGEYINDGCSDDTHTYWCTNLVTGRIIKIRNSDHSIIDDHSFNYEILACGAGGFDEGISTIDFDQFVEKLYWVYCRDHLYCSPSYNACRHIIRADTNLAFDVDNIVCGSGTTTPTWQNMIRIYSNHILHHQSYHPSSGALMKRDLDCVSVGDEVTGTNGLIYTCIRDHTAQANNRPITGVIYWDIYWKQEGTVGGTWVDGKSYYNYYIGQQYLQNIFGIKNGNLFTLMYVNSTDHPAYLYCIDFAHMSEISKKDVSYYAGQKWGDYPDWAWTSVSAMNEQTEIIIIVRWNHVLNQNFVASFKADSSLELLSDVPLYSMEKGNIDRISDEPQVWTMKGAV